MPHNRLQLLLQAVRGMGKVLILPHNNPDPDAIASAVALRYLLSEMSGVDSRITYHGIIGRAENRALVRFLDHPLQPLSDSDLRQSVPVALVDTQPGAGNNSLPSRANVAVVLDHHAWREETTPIAAFADVRPDLGATSTMLTEYFQAADLEPPSALVTALFYGIKTDTSGLSRSASPADVTAYLYLRPRIDIEALAEIEQAQVPISYFRSFGAALRAARIYDGVLMVFVGPMEYPDLTAELAHLLLRLEKSRWVICVGYHGDALHLSVRTQSPASGAEEMARAIVGEEGTAGGHGAMAGGQIPLKDRDPEQLAHRLLRQACETLRVPLDNVGKPLI